MIFFMLLECASKGASVVDVRGRQGNIYFYAARISSLFFPIVNYASRDGSYFLPEKQRRPRCAGSNLLHTGYFVPDGFRSCVEKRVVVWSKELVH